VTIVVAGALANKPDNGGEAWVRLSYIRGFERLGLPVYFVEQIDHAACTDRALGYWDAVVETFDLVESSALVRSDGVVLRGDEKRLRAVNEAAELLLNISGNLTYEPLFSRFRRRGYIDLDPGYTQFWAGAGHPVGRLADHHVHFTVGWNVGTGRSSIPDVGVVWRPTLPPVVLSDWPERRAVDRSRFTTVASWRGSYGRVEHGGVLYGQKAHEFRRFVELPSRVDAVLEVALAVDAADDPDVSALRERGWVVVDARKIASEPMDFRDYIQKSGAEFSVAQGIYVETNSGWFSDRTTRYLASGKPALVQATDFSSALPLGEGLLVFRTLDEAAAGAEEISGDHERHARAARALAEAFFDSDRVLTKLLEDALP